MHATSFSRKLCRFESRGPIISAESTCRRALDSAGDELGRGARDPGGADSNRQRFSQGRPLLDGARAGARDLWRLDSAEITRRRPLLTGEPSGESELCRFESPGAPGRVPSSGARAGARHLWRFDSAEIPRRPLSHRGAERRYGSLPIRVARRGRPICGRRPAGVLGQLESAELGHGASRRVAVGAARRGHAGGPPRAEVGRPSARPTRIGGESRFGSAWRARAISADSSRVAFGSHPQGGSSGRLCAEPRRPAREAETRPRASLLERTGGARLGHRSLPIRVRRAWRSALRSPGASNALRATRIGRDARLGDVRSAGGLLRPTMRRSGRVAEAAPGRSSLPEGRAARSKSPQDLCDSNGQRSRDSSETRTIVRARRCGATRSTR